MTLDRRNIRLDFPNGANYNGSTKLEPTPTVYRFGPFRFRRGDLTLTKHDTRVRLRGQAAKVLGLLLERQGQPVFRDEITKLLWPAGHSPLFDPNRGITQAIADIRASLQDNAKNPRYIVRQGDSYHFGGKTEVGESDEVGSNIVLQPSGPAPRGLIWSLIGGLIFTLLALLAAAFRGAYGLGIFYALASCALAIILTNLTESTRPRRLALAALVFAAMAFTPSAASLAQVLESTINAGTLQPAIIYPWVTGCKFVPLFFLVLTRWALYDRDVHAPAPATVENIAYLAGGIVFLLLTVFATATGSGDLAIWTNHIPEGRAIYAAFVVVAMLNLAVWMYGHWHFQRPIADRALLFVAFGLYLPLAVIAYWIGTQYNLVNLRYLDLRRPQAYVVRNPQAAAEFVRPGLIQIATIGPDLRTLLNLPEFLQALKTEKFYRQNFDEAFQFDDKAVMYGYKISKQGFPPRFRIVRLPKKLAEALVFQPID